MILKIGSQGNDVKSLQQKLGITADGMFGRNTEAALKNWQAQNGLTADGIAGPATFSKMGINVTETTTPIVAKELNLQKLQGVIPDTVIQQIPDTAKEFNITNNLRLAHFLAQCSHESGGFKAVTENLNYSAEGLLKIFPKYFNSVTASQYARNQVKIGSRVYANRMGNGDEASQDGYRFRGRGYIQLTGKSNYIAFGKYINQDFITNPDALATTYPLASAAFFFQNNNLWSICDQGSDTATITALTKRINGGTNGLEDRINQFNKFYNLLK